MAPRTFREECGAPGCFFVAGPSRDQSRVQRIVDAHRATAHVLRPDESKGRAPVAGSATEYRRQARERAERIVPHLATYRRFESGQPGYVEVERGSYGDRVSRLARRRDQAERLASLVDLAWRQPG